MLAFLSGKCFLYNEKGFVVGQREFTEDELLLIENVHMGYNLGKFMEP